MPDFLLMRRAPGSAPHSFFTRASRPLWLSLGLLMVVLGFIGALLPLMPTIGVVAVVAGVQLTRGLV